MARRAVQGVVHAVQRAVREGLGMPKITKRFVDSAAPRPEKWIAWDDELSGFGVSVMPSGVKSYVVRFRTAEGRDHRLTIGRHGVVAPDQARTMAREILVEVAKGENPAAERRDRREGATMSDLFDLFFSRHVEPHLTRRTAVGYRYSIEKHLRPAVGALKVAGFTKQDAQRVHFAMRDTPGQANRALAVLSKALALAEEWGMRAEGLNPCAKVKKYPEEPRERFLSAVEVDRLGQALTEAETVGLPWVVDESAPQAKHLAKPENRSTRVDPAVVAVVRLLLLTGARLSEITELEWAHVDFEAETIALPHQKGRKRRPAPVPTAAMDLLARRERVEGSPFVFPRASDPSRSLSNFVVQSGWERIRRRAGLDDVRLHDLRHTVGTWAARTGANAFQIRDVLRHAGVAMTSRYVNSDHDPQRALVERVGSALSAALDGRRAEVVPLGGRRGSKP